jgi:hypothetical protein
MIDASIAALKARVEAWKWPATSAVTLTSSWPRR